VAPDIRKARDLSLLDSIEAFDREAISLDTWRVVRVGRDPLQGAASRSRWCNETFDVLYTSLERDGAVAEVFALLNSQPVFPSKIEAHAHLVSVSLNRVLRLDGLESLAALGVEVSRFKERDYLRTQAIADAARFLDFEGIIVPSARWNCSNFVIFSDRIAPDAISHKGSETDPIDWTAWRRKRTDKG
jgi:RES domain-containing protein